MLLAHALWVVSHENMVLKCGHDFLVSRLLDKARIRLDEIGKETTIQRVKTWAQGDVNL